ncbi:MAG: SDR family NAD(P)-dependent oxidoreductase [Planctomycetia bacterium]|nr:SDR family NAD(P)-dependent oxidoreductase [Planctomycetia bacterium]
MDRVRTPSREAASATRLVVGCGYLGTRVARRWIADGDRVVGITRSPSRAESLAACGIVPLVADMTAGAEAPAWHAVRSLPACDTVFWAVGFDRSAGTSHHDVHVGGLSRLLDALAGSPRVILSSSTGVWGDEGGGVVTERTPARPGREAGRVLIEAEDVLRGHRLGPGVALRFAGLYGPDRLPRLDDLRAGRPLAADPDSWLNLIHVDDAAAVVRAVAAAPAPRPLYVVSDGTPVLRRDWYGRLAQLTGCPAPSWDTAAPRSRGADKRVDPAALYGDLAIPLAHPDPLRGIEGVLREAGRC